MWSKAAASHLNGMAGEAHFLVTGTTGLTVPPSCRAPVSRRSEPRAPSPLPGVKSGNPSVILSQGSRPQGEMGPRCLGFRFEEELQALE